MTRPMQLSARRILAGIAVVIAAVVGSVYWLSRDGGPAPPFPEIGFVRDGENITHTVIHRQVDPLAHSANENSRSTWKGSLSFDNVDHVDAYDDDGRYRRRLATTSQAIGIEVAAWDWMVWHIDVDSDGVIDLSVFRRPIESNQPRLPANEPIGYVAQPHEEYVVARSGTGDSLAALYAEGGLYAAVCSSGVFPDAGPLNPDEAAAVADRGDLTIWCTHPRQRPERLESTLTEAAEGHVDEGKQVRSE